MNRYEYDVAVIGGGPAGLAAACAAKEAGAESVVVLERDSCLGGILGQCIHTGFGLKYFGEELSGPEYAERFIDKAGSLGIQALFDTMVLSIDPERLVISAVNSSAGACEIAAGAIVLAMGCRERTRAAISLPGTRPAGIFTAGTAQRYMNIQNYRVGKNVVILGSGDIGMIMARRLTLENIHVEAVVEILPYLAGLTRNRVQCLDDFGIPLYLGHTITNVRGEHRVSGVTVAKVDEYNQPVPGTEWDIACDTLLLSVGLIPENELSKNCGVKLDPLTGGPIVDSAMQTNVRGIFAAGNVLHVNDLVDNVSTESERAGVEAARFAKGICSAAQREIVLKAGENVRYVVPQTIRADETRDKVSVYFRVCCPQRSVMTRACANGQTLVSHKRVKVNPGEMEELVIETQKLREAGLSEIAIEAVHEEKGAAQ